MKNLLFVLLLILPVSLSGIHAGADDSDTTICGPSDDFFNLQPGDRSDFPPLDLLKTAMAGYEILVRDKSISRSDVITIIDFSLQSDMERLWVLDLKQGKVLFHCLVSHGRNSGDLKAKSFSNSPGSYESSPGFYATGETYIGKHGLSLKLDGLESGINDKARARAIVIHGADYVSDEFIKNNGRLGRSLGCPAVPVELSENIIKAIKGGSCLFIYSPQTDYTSNSPVLSRIKPITKT